MNKFKLRQVIRRRSGTYFARDWMRRHHVKAAQLYRVLREMEQAGEVVRWGYKATTRWQVVEGARAAGSLPLWDVWGWPDPATWPESVPLGYTGSEL